MPKKSMQLNYVVIRFKNLVPKLKILNILIIWYTLYTRQIYSKITILAMQVNPFDNLTNQEQ